MGFRFDLKPGFYDVRNVRGAARTFGNRRRPSSVRNTRNFLHVNGNNRLHEPVKVVYNSPPLCLPGNGGLLPTAGMMAAGWDGAAKAAGFPERWNIETNGIIPFI